MEELNEDQASNRALIMRQTGIVMMQREILNRQRELAAETEELKAKKRTFDLEVSNV